MQRFRVISKPPAAILFVLLIIGLMAALIYTLSSSDEPVHSQATDRQRIESNDPLVQRTGSWTTQTAPEASGGNYLYSSGSQDDILTLTFSGNYVEVDFVGGPNLAMLALDVDNTVRRTVVTATEQSQYNQQAIIDYLDAGPHTLKVYAQEGGVIAVDAFVVGVSKSEAQATPALTLTPQPSLTPNEPISEVAATATMEALLATVDKSKLGDEVIVYVQQEGEIVVDVAFYDPPITFSLEKMDEWTKAVAVMQDEVLQYLEGYNYSEVSLTSVILGFSLKADLVTLIRLQSHPSVKKIGLVYVGTVSSIPFDQRTSNLLEEAHLILRDNVLRDRYSEIGLATR